ncbi:unnamed protein product [Rotaria sp. Silwood1]|nr:unnamed protein product [Rotaria sp. Silwood1]
MNVSSYLDAVLITYSNYYVNFKSISKPNFDLICKHIVPDRVIGLILSNDEDTPGLAELFLTYFQINQFTHLQSLTLFDIGPHLWENIIQSMVELKNLRSFFYTQPSRINSWISDITGFDLNQLDSRLFNIYGPILPQLCRLKLSHGDFLNSIQFPQLQHLILERSSVDIVKHISSVATRLKSLETKFELDDSTTQFLYPLTQLKRLVLEIEGSNISMSHLEEMMSNLPRLKHLILIVNCNCDVVNGQRWQMIVQHLITFNFMFNLSVSLESQDLDSFRTSFWLEEKHWFVACGRKNLYSVPHFYQTTVDEDFQFPLFSTVSDNIIFYETINRLTLSSISNNTNHYFPHVQTLGIDYPHCISTLKSILDLCRVQHFVLNLSVKHFPVMYLLREMPNLCEISIKKEMNIFLKRICSKKLKNIRRLTISESFINTSIYSIEKLSMIFPNIEHLHIYHTCSTTEMIDFLDRFKHLKTASFQYMPHYSNREEVQKSCHNIRSVFDQIQCCQKLNFTYRFDKLSVHIWFS